MERRRICLGLAAVLVATAMLAGCPTGPMLEVQPLALTLGDGGGAASFRITNAGSGSLSWRAEVLDAGWLQLRAEDGTAAQTVTGETKSETDFIEVIVVAADLPPSLSTAQIRVAADTGEEEIVRVSVSVAESALLTVSDAEVDFGVSGRTSEFDIGNAGAIALDWELAISGDTPWLAASPQQGTLASEQSATISLSVDRGELAAGIYTGSVTVRSSGGDVTVPVSMAVPPFAVVPEEEIEFGKLTQPATQFLNIVNNGFDPVEVAFSATGASWLSLDAASASIPGQDTVNLGVTADPTGVEPDEYSGILTVAAAGGGYAVNLPVSMSLSRVRITPRELDFGTLTAAEDRTVTVENLGSAPVSWSITVPGAAQSWLAVAPEAGTLTDTAGIQVSADPGGLAPGSYNAVLTLEAEGSQETIPVDLLVPRPPTLRVEPNNINFGTSQTNQLVGIWNEGIGTIDWSIDTSGFPVWLSVEEAGGASISGDVTGDETDAITLAVNRSAVTGDATDFSHAFTVTASEGAPVTVEVQMSIPLVPDLVLIPDGVDLTGLSYIDVPTDVEDNSFFIQNQGNGPLDWRVLTPDTATWITAITPSQGSLEPGRQQEVTVFVTRESLTYEGASTILTLASNDPFEPEIALEVRVQVEPKVAIGVRPSAVNLGIDAISTFVEVANFGDPDTMLYFQVNKTEDWLAVYPKRGSSEGTLGNVKDWVPISVTVDRSQLNGTDSTAKLIISAYETQGGEIVPLDVEKAEIEVSVEAAELTIEAAKPRTRIPSLSRYVLLMRNIQYQALPLPDTRLDQVAELITLFEQETPLELTETNQFLVSGKRVRGNLLILLDYSGSMQAAAHKVADAPFGEVDDALQLLYEETIPSLIAEIPSNYRIGLAVFNERANTLESPIRLIYGGPDEDADTRDEVYIDDRPALIERMRNIVVVDNGATVLLPAIEQAAIDLTLHDLDRNRIPFDDADVRGIVCVTDGRLTTPPGLINETTDLLSETNTRLFCVGWGEDVLVDPLVRMTSGSGGHFYATRSEPTGEFDPFGLPLRVPLVAELRDWCETDAMDECDQSIPKDLDSQVMLAYVTLNHERNVTIEGRLSFDDPNDQRSPCLEEQGEISGRWSHNQVNYQGIVGDPRLGQISLHTDGLRPDGTATIIVRADYMPRNITRLAFLINAPGITLDVQQIPEFNGGLIYNWRRTGTAPIYTYTAPDDPLHYGEFGDMLRIEVSNAFGPFVLNFDVQQPQISDDPNSKYFTFPDTLTVTGEPFLASSFPSLYFGGTPTPTEEEDGAIVYDLGTTLDSAEIQLYNLGGSHPETGVGIDWEATLSEGVGLSIEPLIGFVTSTTAPDTIDLSVDRGIAPGVYEGLITVEYNYGTLNLSFDAEPILIRYEITESALQISQTEFDFGDTTTDFLVEMENTGQGTINWFIENPPLFPRWLIPSANAGVLNAGGQGGFRLSVDRDFVTQSDSYTFTISTDIGEVYELTATVLPRP